MLFFWFNNESSKRKEWWILRLLQCEKNSCDNKIFVLRKLIEQLVLDEVRKRMSSLEQIRHLLKRVEDEISKLYSDIPESTQRKEYELQSEERRLKNYIDFIGEGKGSRALSEALLESEKKIDTLQDEINGLRQTRDKVF